MKIVIFFLTISLLGCFASCSTKTIDATTSNDINITIESLNQIYKVMEVNEQYKYELAEECYYMITKPSEGFLQVSFFMQSYENGAADYKLAYESKYIFNIIADSLVATKCLEKEVVIQKYEMNHECVDATMTAAKIIGLELEGMVDLKNFKSGNLEKCIASKLQPKEAVTPYMNCLIKILGNPVYAEKELAAILETKRKMGYTCTEENNCYKHEDPQVLANIIKLEKGTIDSVPIPFDTRKRLCELEAKKTDDFNEGESVNLKKSYTYSCNFWVEEIYCDVSSNFLNWAVKYVNYKKNEDGQKVKVSEDIFYTNAFDITAPSVEKIRVDWSNGVRMNQFGLKTDGKTKAVFGLIANFSDGTKAYCKHHKAASMASGERLFKTPLKGELAGFEYSISHHGVKVQNIYERT